MGDIFGNGKPTLKLWI